MTTPDTNLETNYAAGGFGQSLPWGTTPAVLVIDFCDAYLVEGSPLYAAAEPARASVARLVEEARSRSVPVIFTRVEFDPGGANGGLFFKKVGALRCFERGNPLADSTRRGRSMARSWSPSSTPAGSSVHRSPRR